MPVCVRVCARVSMCAQRNHLAPNGGERAQCEEENARERVRLHSEKELSEAAAV